MTGIKKTGQKQLMVFAGRSNRELAQEVVEHLGIELTPTDIYDFPNGEIYTRVEESVRGCDAFVLQSHYEPINERIMEQLIMVDALKRASAKRITVVAPFYGYARQDKKSRGRTAEHNWALLHALPTLVGLGFPVLIGASRKRFLGALLAADGVDRPPAGREVATAAVSTLSAAGGAWGVRVHDVAASRDAVEVAAAWRAGGRRDTHG